MSFSTRLSAVEKLLISEHIALVMRDDTRQYILGDGEILVHWFCLAMRWVHHQRHGAPRPALEFPQELGWIRDSMGDDEQGKPWSARFEAHSLGGTANRKRRRNNEQLLRRIRDEPTLRKWIKAGKVSVARVGGCISKETLSTA